MSEVNTGNGDEDVTVGDPGEDEDDTGQDEAVEVDDRGDPNIPADEA